MSSSNRLLRRRCHFRMNNWNTVLSTLMFHHLPRRARQQCAQEMRRVSKPGGRVLVIDFAAPETKQNGFIRHFHRHGHVRLGDILAILETGGLDVVETGDMNFRNVKYALAMLPSRN